MGRRYYFIIISRNLQVPFADFIAKIARICLFLFKIHSGYEDILDLHMSIARLREESERLAESSVCQTAQTVNAFLLNKIARSADEIRNVKHTGLTSRLGHFGYRNSPRKDGTVS